MKWKSGGTRLESLCKSNFRRPGSQKKATMSLRMFLIDQNIPIQHFEFLVYDFDTREGTWQGGKQW